MLASIFSSCAGKIICNIAPPIIASTQSTEGKERAKKVLLIASTVKAPLSFIPMQQPTKKMPTATIISERITP